MGWGQRGQVILTDEISVQLHDIAKESKGEDRRL